MAADLTLALAGGLAGGLAGLTDLAAAGVATAAPAAPVPPVPPVPAVQAFGDALAVPSVVCLWIAVLLRIPAALKSPQQRGLLLAVATAAAAMTLNLPDVVTYAMRNPDHSHTVGLIRNLIGVLSAGAVLYFVAAATQGRRLRLAALVTTVALLSALLALDAAAPDHGTHTIPPQGDPVPSLAYWLVLISAHLLANTTCVFVCWRYGRQAESRGLAVGLRLFGLGTALAGLFWFAYLLKALFGSTWAMPYLPLLMNLHGFLRAAAILVPTLFVLRTAYADITTTWRLWPLWHDLVQAVPHVALTKPRATRLVELLWPPVPRNLLVYRKVIETRDAILILGEYVPPGVRELAETHVSGAGVPAPRRSAAALACVLKEARRNMLDGLPQHQQQDGRQQPPAPAGTGAAAVPAGAEGSDLEDETTFLVAVAQAYGSATTHSFTPATAGGTPGPPRK
ncbi:MAB_1171c family putative transporter [Streptomyces sp. NPDC090022]|uniref:MAB_1171c family putative transporter n=1 Tax=Streptomyces sp. NPDC090022 TaxID=3365920 RepID=UPI00381CE933